MRILSWSAKPTMEWTSKTELPLVHTIHTESKVRLSHYDGRYFVKICGSNFHHLPSTSVNFPLFRSNCLIVSNRVQLTARATFCIVCDKAVTSARLTTISRPGHDVHTMFTRCSLEIHCHCDQCDVCFGWFGLVTSHCDSTATICSTWSPT